MSLVKTLTAAGATAALVLAGATSASAATEPIAATDAPVRIHVGAQFQDFPITVVTSAPAQTMLVDLLDPGYVPKPGGFTDMAGGYADSPVSGRPNVFKVTVQLYDKRVTSWGKALWSFGGERVGADGESVSIEGSREVDVRAHSMLGLATTRSGSTVTVKGSLRAYNNVQERYAAWSNRPISVQRLSGSSWVQVAGARTNSQGDVVGLKLKLPTGTPLRLVAGDTATAWGAVSKTVTR